MITIGKQSIIQRSGLYILCRNLHSPIRRLPADSIGRIGKVSNELILNPTNPETYPSELCLAQLDIVLDALKLVHYLYISNDILVQFHIQLLFCHLIPGHM